MVPLVDERPLQLQVPVSKCRQWRTWFTRFEPSIRSYHIKNSRRERPGDVAIFGWISGPMSRNGLSATIWCNRRPRSWIDHPMSLCAGCSNRPVARLGRDPWTLGVELGFADVVILARTHALGLSRAMTLVLVTTGDRTAPKKIVFVATFEDMGTESQ